MRIIRNIFLILLLAVLAIGAYAWIKYKQPTFSFGKKINLVALSDTSCRLNVSVKIQNENFFTLSIKDLEADLGNDIKAMLEDPVVEIPGSSDSTYILPVKLSFHGINNVVDQLSNAKDSSNSKKISLNVKAGILPFFYHVTHTITDTSKRDGKKVLALLLQDNISIVGMSKPGAISMDSSQMNIEIKIKNPYSIPFIVKNYKLLVKDPADENSTLAQLESTNELIMQPYSEQKLTNSLQVHPGSAILETLINFVKNEEYKLNFSAMMSVSGHEFPLSQNFSYKLFRK